MLVPRVQRRTMTFSTNTKTGDELKMQKLYELDNERGKAMGYRKAISMLKTLRDPLTSVKQLDDFSYIGDGIKLKVQEFLNSG